MPFHFHTINRLSIPLDFKHGCQGPAKEGLLSPEGKALINSWQQSQKTSHEIDKQFASEMDKLSCYGLLKDNVPPMAGRIGRTVTGRRVTALASKEPHVLLMQELTGHDCEPMKKALSEFGYSLIHFAPHQSESRNRRPQDLLHGTAIFLRDPENVLEVIAKDSLPVSKEEVEVNPRLSSHSAEDKNRIAKKITGRKVTTCVFRLKGSHLAFSAGSEHLVGFNRHAPTGPELEASRLAGAIQHESHLQKQLTFIKQVEAEHGIKVVAMVSGGDFNEDDRFACRTCEQTGSKVPDDLYRLKISSDFGFMLPENPVDQQPCELISEPGEQAQIDFLTLRSNSEIKCKFENNFNSYRDQVEEDLDGYPSDHIMISADLTIPEPVQSDVETA
ncbi:hypothetical protein [Endozoicomonas sp. YOMI1]|uniref:hypothetical protein n=1 Tax=Endozoicomonas sp. YOMI1 TaxID=2828739 RepID=UPI002147E129|nr:hypothetical protein [Endozoicomonas sp. YOMI1]